MDLQVNLVVQYEGETQSFLVSDPQMTTWADVEAMVKLTFDLNDVQLKYMDEDNEEVSVNSQGEYEEALKSAVKQGNKLHFHVYVEPFSENSCCRSDSEAMPIVKPQRNKEKKPLGHYSMLARTIGQEMKMSQEVKQELKQSDADSGMEHPPAWFGRYMDTMRQQIVTDTVEMLRREFQEKVALHLQPLPSSSCTQPAFQVLKSYPSDDQTYDWLLACNNCQTRIIGIRYQCSVCPEYSICELCEAGTYAHDPNHAFLKLRRPSLSDGVGPQMFSVVSLPPVDNQRLQQLNRNLLKAEKQRLRAEKRQRKAEMKEVKKQLKIQKRSHLWNIITGTQDLESTRCKPESFQSSTVINSVLHCSSVIPTLNAEFVDENVPDGTCMPPENTFTKHWEMKNSGNVEWSALTKLVFMWGNLSLASSTTREVPVPFLQPGQTGMVFVDFLAPTSEGTYTSHWRLAHRGVQFGPRVWCSIVVDACHHSGSGQKENGLISSCKQEIEKQSLSEMKRSESSLVTTSAKKQQAMVRGHDLYIPSVDLLTAHDLLSFELMDANITQDLERVPHNTPVDMTPCMSPLPVDGPVIERVGLSQIAEESEGVGHGGLIDVTLCKKQTENTSVHDEVEEEISGTQFVCETVIRSLAMDEAPDHKLPHRSSLEQEAFSFNVKSTEDQSTVTVLAPTVAENESDAKMECVEEKWTGSGTEKSAVSIEKGICSSAVPEEKDTDESDEVQSQGSSSFSEDYIVVLPDCFDTSRPLGESMYSSALSQPGTEGDLNMEIELETLEDRSPEGASRLQMHSVNDMLCASQTLDTITLTPEVVPPAALYLRKNANADISSDEEPEILFVTEDTSDDAAAAPTSDSREVPAGQDSETLASPSVVVNGRQKVFQHNRSHGGIAGELVKGALSVATSAYKALFTGQQHSESQRKTTQEEENAVMGVLFEMGFCDRQLNQRLLKKYNYNLVEVVTELIHISDNDWYTNRY
ncbi:next to BRCA1 gene 1 protein isoform X2 [Protopterus annectens]|uniref:next to BRCA1 gene 1 protein isoform X2 n=1 Tax=Protopterus annectens TaxID=7888 RepID=UPI001CF9B3DF|nr:next to BRCA1 gene 1 protein isoform X2 [Protopterus annectens]